MLLYLATDFPHVAKSPTAKHGVECYSATREYSKKYIYKKSVFITNARVKKKKGEKTAEFVFDNCTRMSDTGKTNTHTHVK